MVSFPSPPSPAGGRKIAPSELESLWKKRKLNHESELAQEFPEKSPLRVQNMISTIPNTELHLATPLPLEWQQCLDIKSGQIYFYNTRTQKRSFSDPRSSTAEPSSPPAHMISLDLELNLPCGSSPMGKNQVVGENFITKLNSGSVSSSTSDHHQILNSCPKNNDNNKSTGGLSRSPSWLTFEGEEEEEMVTAVCKNCHMLVMMSKSFPACPNCKFVHSQEQSTSTLFKRRLSLLC